MVSNIEFFSNVATATLADASTALGLNLIMDAPRPVVPESDLPPSNRSMLNERIFGTLSV